MPVASNFLANALTKVKGLKSSTAAMIACGMQHELAAHLMLQCQSMGRSIILRAGSPPVYNQKRGPKTGLNLSKTSNQGLFKGSLAAEVQFTRLRDGKGIGLHATDASHLSLSVNDPDYQHTVALPITMQDILREIGPQGDLQVLGYTDGKLRLAYKEGKGDKDFRGQFIIDLNKTDSTPVFYSRPWDRPDHNPSWDPEKKIITKPEALKDVPDELYAKIQSSLFTVAYADHQNEHFEPSDIKEAKVFANTPKTGVELLKAIHDNNILHGDSHASAAMAYMDTNTSMHDILAVLSETQIRALYDSCGLVTTGDWDGLALGHPPLCDLKGFPAEKMRSYNTFKTGVDGLAEIDGLVKASCEYLNYLKHDPTLAGTPLATLLQTIEDPVAIFSEFAIKGAGCITPHEFVFQQLINYSYRDTQNLAYGGKAWLESLQSSLDAGLLTFAAVKDDIKLSSQEILDHCLKTTLDEYEKRSSKEGSIHPLVRELLKEHLTKHIKIAIDNGGGPYRIPHPYHDHNVHELFQHGFDLRNPYGSNLDGAWFMVTDEGGTLYGDTQEQLIETLLIDNFLEKNIIEVSPCVNMGAGWGDVIAKQIELKQMIPPNTLEKYELWQLEMGLKTTGIKTELLRIKSDEPIAPIEEHTDDNISHGSS